MGSVALTSTSGPARAVTATVVHVDELERIALSAFGLEVVTRLPVTQSFSSTVLSFLAGDGRHYVVKQHWARNKAEREAAALRALDAHPDVPTLLATNDAGATLTLLIEGRDGVPWERVAGSPTALFRRFGHSVAQLHRTSAASFDGVATWHELLVANAHRYVDAVAGDDHELVGRASLLLERHLAEVPSSDSACLVHFDLRPGNVLVSDDEFVAVIDFESCRGGHASMDFFKLWQQVAPVAPDGWVEFLDAYVEASGAIASSWLDADALDRLMRIYGVYHGLAGLAWSHTRNDFSGDFPAINRALIADGFVALA